MQVNPVLICHEVTDVHHTLRALNHQRNAARKVTNKIEDASGAELTFTYRKRHGLRVSVGRHMDTNYRANIAKWLPLSSPPLEKWFTDSLTLDNIMDKLARDIALIVKDIAESNSCDPEVVELQSLLQHDLITVIDNLESIIRNYRLIWGAVAPTHPVYKYKVDHLSTVLKRRLNILAKFTRGLIFDIIDCKNDNFLRVLFRLVNAHNDMLDLQHDVSVSSINIFYNDCPSMLESMKKISVTRLLQVLAKNKAEEYCHELIECLLANYQPNSEREDLKSPVSADIEMSENSSVEIYRALTKHMTPPITNAPAPEVKLSNIENMQVLVNTQNQQVIGLLNIAKDVSPRLLGAEALKLNKVSGETRVRKSAVRKVTDYYQEVAWGAVSSILDHVVLWWSPEALAARHSHGSQHLKDWLHQFTQGRDVPPTVRPALQNLCDALGCHVTVTAWDQLFRLAYTSAFECQSRPSSTEGTDTGQNFCEVFQLLVTLSNECEVGGEWVVGAPLAELPLSEQILVLHRLDHSIHTMRLWAMQEAKLIAHTWDLDVFFLLVKGDLKNCNEELSYLKLADHTNALTTEIVNVQVYVCAKMRAKIVSEVQANIQLLKESPAKCIDTLAIICRVVSLANLHMCFPRRNYWRKSRNDVPVAASLYVETYLERVLLPVLEVIEDPEISNMILKIMCEAWLDYIYLHRIKFSEWGALQLLTDFAYVSTWVTDCAIISQNVRSQLLKNEVLRRCEGVGRLLLRHPGEAIAMHKRPGTLTSLMTKTLEHRESEMVIVVHILARMTDENGSPESLGLERMPAEMYVPNQEQWLELRAPKRYNFCCTE